MNIIDAQQLVDQARSRRFLGGAECPDDELLLWRERLHNGMTMFYGLATVVGYFLIPGIWAWLGTFGMMMATILTLAGMIYAARWHSVTANRFRAARCVLASHLKRSAEQLMDVNRP